MTLIMDMTNSEIASEMNKITRKAMSQHQVFRYRSLSSELSRRFDAGKIDEISEYLSKSPARQAVFDCIYRRGNRPKSAEHIAGLTKLTKVRVLQIATPLAHKGYVIEQKENGKKSFLKQKGLVSSRDKILRLARNRKRLKALADVKLGKVHVTVKVNGQWL